MTTVNKVIIKVLKCSKGSKKRKYEILYDQKINPPVFDKQILAALKQQYDVLSLVIENGVAIALVDKKTEIGGEQNVDD